jgi:uncharacterized protein YegP (UPF0339 family)
MGTFWLPKENDEFQFVLKRGMVNILASEGYTTKAACLNGIESEEEFASRCSFW